jgi:hypothetical protein
LPSRYAADVDITDWSAIVQGVSAFIIAIFAVLAWRTARGALAESRRQANAASEALEAAREQARLSQEAVAAANISVIEARRQGQLARLPFVRVDRPRLGLDSSGEPYVEVHVLNLGYGPALELRLVVERQDHAADDHWYQDLRGTSPSPILEEDAGHAFHHSARDLRNANADWEEGMRSAGTGHPPLRQPLVTQRLRFTFSYLSMTGGRVEQVWIWETDRLHLPPDPWTWRLATLTLDPGPESGAPIVVRRPD